MSTRTFGQHATPVGAVGLGCMSFAGFYGAADDTESLRTLGRALELGVTHWDTANAYGKGHSERVIGRFFAETPGSRARVHLATKFAISSTPDGKRYIDNSPAHMRASIEASLQRLGVEQVDIYYLHRLSTEIPVEDTVGELAKLVAEGKIAGIGLSEISPDTLRRAHAVHPIAAVQSEYSLWSRGPELGLIQACAELGTTFVAFSPVGRGYFGGKMDNGEALAAAEFMRSNPRFVGENWARNCARLQPFLDLATAWGVAPATLAIAWTLAKGSRIIPIPGTRSIPHLEQDAAAAELVLSSDQVAEIERIYPAGHAAGERYSPAQWSNVERYG